MHVSYTCSDCLWQHADMGNSVDDDISFQSWSCPRCTFCNHAKITHCTFCAYHFSFPTVCKSVFHCAWLQLAQTFILQPLSACNCLQCFDTVGWATGRVLACKKLSGGMLTWLCLGQGTDLHMAQLMPLPLTVSCSSKSRLVLPSWFCLSGAGSPG